MKKNVLKYTFMLLALFVMSRDAYAQNNIPQDLLSSGFKFEKNLKMGDSSYPDVNYLQYFLNKDDRTMVSRIGAGSDRQTTSFFGSKTKKALNSFQNIYKLPQGIFGSESRAKANQILDIMRSATTTASKQGSNNSFRADDEKVINLMSEKIDRQTNKITSNSQKESIKTNIIAKLKDEIRRARFQSYINKSGFQMVYDSDKEDLTFKKDSLGPSGWEKFLTYAKKAFSTTVAHAYSKSSSNQNLALGFGGGGAETPFGGMHVLAIQCTCGQNTLHYILDYRTNNLLALIYQPGSSILYSNYNLYGTYELGTYGQVTQSCQIEAGEDCVELQSDGDLGHSPGTGTS